MLNLNDLFYYAQVVEHGGFAPAGRALGIPKSKLSRRVSALEERLDVRLIHRTTRQFTVTEVGRTYYEHCRAMLIEAEAAQESIDTLRAAPRGIIKLTCPVGLLHFHVGAMLADFMAQCPHVTVHLEATNRRVDVINEGVDIAIRVRPLPLEDSDLVMRVLSDRGQCLVASPSLVERLGMPDSPEDLSQWPSLSRSTPHEAHEWILQNVDGQSVVVRHQPRYVTTDMVALMKAALTGVGIVQLPALMLTEELSKGTLIRLLPDWPPRRELIHIVFPSRRGLLPSVRALIDFLVERYTEIDED
ncbi:LysR family transcriptional regulator [Nitrincola alkalilacustris]|uniref:LysR family transcriptional regulator n=1 Tax=Nitrincola alkalilacustris TaxID=1571224 RepID=UPI00124E410F|nr:LysR family transcriptional regulator [Nitrincola alkalilacustris]